MTKKALLVAEPPPEDATEDELDAFARDMVAKTRAAMRETLQEAVAAVAADWNETKPWNRSTDWIVYEREPGIRDGSPAGGVIGYDPVTEMVVIDIGWWDNADVAERERVMREFAAS